MPCPAALPGCWLAQILNAEELAQCGAHLPSPLLLEPSRRRHRTSARRDEIGHIRRARLILKQPILHRVTKIGSATTILDDAARGAKFSLTTGEKIWIWTEPRDARLCRQVGEEGWLLLRTRAWARQRNSRQRDGRPL